ncbi:WD40-repeat-containing domain protein [Baffinella frigidus]|nr:WD40-repeat-containing domain protein [Cryptophyta sp. CCMP2293]
MVKAYQRYQLGEKGTLGAIASTTCCDVQWGDASGHLAFSASLDAVVLWNLRTGAKVAELRDPEGSAEVASLTVSSSSRLVGVGHQDGKVRLWERDSLEMRVALDGHRAVAGALAFNDDGTLLASGSFDTDVIVWDVVAESGLYRLRGHKDAVTAVCFIAGGGGPGRLVSASKDSLIKVWELEQQHCMQTLTGHRSEVWALTVDPASRRMISGGSDAELRVWAINPDAKAPTAPPAGGAVVSTWGEEDKEGSHAVTFLGSVPKGSRARVGRLGVCGGGVVMCQTMDKNVQMLRIRSKEEAVKKMRRRLKRAREKGTAEKGAADTVSDAAGVAHVPTAGDEIQQLSFFSASHKLRAAAAMCMPDGAGGGGVKVLCALSNNALEVWEVGVEKGAEAVLGAALYQPGHRSDVRAVALSNDDTAVAACAGGELKVWNLQSGHCFRSLASGYGVCCAFVPGDKYIVVGTKQGQLQLVDVAAAEMVGNFDAHEGSVWALAMRPDGKGFVTAGADKEVKFWEYGAEKTESGATQLTLSVAKAVTMEDDVLAVSFSPDGKFLALALLDTTVKVFQAETMKFFLSLYGHRLPVLCLDISTDSTLLVTGSADKNVKVWGLDFGDCHKSMFAHQDNVMAVKFVPRTHYFFSGGKDKIIKMWDADKFVQITTIRAHYSEVWCMAISKSGDLLVSGSHDRSVRVWNRTEEHVYIEEERQKELDLLLEAPENTSGPALDGGAVGGEESAPVAKETKESQDACDRIMEALDRCAQHPDEGSSALQNAILLDMTPDAFFRHTLRKVRSNQLEPALMQLPFDYVTALLTRLESAGKGGADAELMARAALVVVRLHHSRLSTTASALPLLRSLRASTKRALQERCDQAGYNLAALRAIRRRLNDDELTIPSVP